MDGWKDEAAVGTAKSVALPCQMQWRKARNCLSTRLWLMQVDSTSRPCHILVSATLQATKRDAFARRQERGGVVKTPSSQLQTAMRPSRATFATTIELRPRPWHAYTRRSSMAPCQRLRRVRASRGWLISTQSPARCKLQLRRSTSRRSLVKV